MAEILKEGMLAEVIVLDRNLFEVKPKEILELDDGKLLKDVIEKTRNLLTMESMSSLFYEKFLIPEAKKKTLQNIMEKSIYMVTFFLWKKTTCLFRSI